MLFVYQMMKSNGESLKTSDLDFAFIKNQKIFVEVADTQEKRAQGLMYVDNIAENQGMIFLFEKPKVRVFWMKNMKIPLDILFINKDIIAKIYKEVPVCENDPCPLYSSKFISDTVIELKKGFCDKYNVKVGDKIKFSNDIKTKQDRVKQTDNQQFTIQ